MPLWIPVTLCAACLQTARTALQKSLQKHLDDTVINWARFAFALPFLPFLLLVVQWVNGETPVFSGTFFLYCLLASIAQIIATAMMLALFSKRSFAVGTAFAKTESLQIALLGIAIFNEPPSWLGGIGILIGGGGVLLMTKFSPAVSKISAFLGLGCGLFFALTAWFIRLSYHSLGTSNAFIAAAYTLFVMIVLQSLLLGAVLIWKKTNFSALWRQRWHATGIGLTSVLGSYGWSLGFMLTNPAYVKTLAQIELPLALLVGRFLFGEKISRREFAGIVAVGSGAILVLGA